MRGCIYCRNSFGRSGGRAGGRRDALGTGWLTGLDALVTLVGLFVCSLGVQFVRTRSWLFLSGVLFTASMLQFAVRQTSTTPDEAFGLPLILRGLSVGFFLGRAAMFTFRAVSTANHGPTRPRRAGCTT